MHSCAAMHAASAAERPAPPPASISSCATCTNHRPDHKFASKMHFAGSLSSRSMHAHVALLALWGFTVDRLLHFIQ